MMFLRSLALFLLAIGWATGVMAQEASVARGEYLARMGDCTSCHTAPGGKPFAGGLAIHAPFGTIYGTNITPDPETGIGRYTLQDFTRVLRHGVTKDGTHLYPAMPYTSYALLTDPDIADLYAYFMHGVPPVHYTPPQTSLVFPLNQRWGIWFWNLLFLQKGPYETKPERSDGWNRGAYLAQSIGHCGGCHTPRGLAFQEKGYSESSRHYLGGAIADGWFSANLRGDADSGLGRWQEADIAAFLKTGHGAGTAAFGNMEEVVENSTQHMTDGDRAALAQYLKSLAASTPAMNRGEALKKRESAVANGALELPGAGLYQSACAGCHKADGTGAPPRFPKLAGNSAVMSDDATSLIRIVLEGGKTPATGTGPAPSAMPAFSRLTNDEIADVVSYIRNAWGNHAANVSPRQVAAVRKADRK